MSAKKTRTNKGDGGVTNIYMPRDAFNTFVTMLDQLIQADENGYWGSQAIVLKNKVLKHSRPYVYEGDDYAALHFFEEDTAIAIKLSVFYASVFMKDVKDFYAEIQK